MMSAGSCDSNRVPIKNQFENKEISLNNSYYFGLFTGFITLFIILIFMYWWEGGLDPEDEKSNINIMCNN